MTCIIGIEHHNSVYIGGDSAAVSTNSIQTVQFPKVFLSGPFLVGYSGSFRMGQLMRYNLLIPDRSEYSSDMEFMAIGLINGIRKVLFDSGSMTKADNLEETVGNFLVGYNGGLYEIGTDFGVTRHNEGYAAIGSGYKFALGAMEALSNTYTNPEEAVKIALEAAARLCTTISGPFHIKRIIK